MDPYEVLGIDGAATAEELKAAYRRLAHLYHPDRLSGEKAEVRVEGERRMAEVNAAYAELVELIGVTVTYELEGWDNGLRAEATRRLLEAQIDHTWRAGDLEVAKALETVVDPIVDRLLCEAAAHLDGRRRR